MRTWTVVYRAVIVCMLAVSAWLVATGRAELEYGLWGALGALLGWATSVALVTIVVVWLEGRGG